MKYLLGIVAIICCLILASFDSFTGSILKNVAWWGVGISIMYMALSTMDTSNSDTT